MLQQVTPSGTFGRTQASIINSNFAAVSQPDLWVRPQYGNNQTADGTYAKPFATMTAALSSSLCVPGVVIGLLGVLFEEVSGPIINDITIRGMATQPRQATTSGAPNGGGATWLAPASGASTHLCIVKGQGWRFENLYFNCATASQACVQVLMSGSGDPPADPSAEHTSFYNCIFTGAKYGILASGGPNFCTIDTCRFFGFADSGDTAIASVTGAGVHSLYGWIIKNSQFYQNAIHIDIAAASPEICYNWFGYVNSGVTTTTQLDMTGSDNAAIHDNNFSVPFNQAGLSAMFVAGTSDRYSRNTLGTACLTPMTGQVWGKPVSGAA